MANTHEATTAELAGIRSDVHEVKHDLASVRASVEECHAENTEFFTSFMSSIEATQQRIDVLRVTTARLFCSPEPIVVL